MSLSGVPVTVDGLARRMRIGCGALRNTGKGSGVPTIPDVLLLQAGGSRRTLEMTERGAL